jgi:hypothetical protein
MRSPIWFIEGATGGETRTSTNNAKMSSSEVNAFPRGKGNEVAAPKAKRKAENLFQVRIVWVISPDF